MILDIPPSDAPAAELPDYEPSPADLVAVATWAEERLAARIEQAVATTAVEARYRELAGLRARLVRHTEPATVYRALGRAA